jgi:hypothetical protein
MGGAGWGGGVRVMRWWGHLGDVLKRRRVAGRSALAVCSFTHRSHQCYPLDPLTSENHFCMKACRPYYRPSARQRVSCAVRLMIVPSADCDTVTRYASNTLRLGDSPRPRPKTEATITIELRRSQYCNLRFPRVREEWRIGLGLKKKIEKLENTVTPVTSLYGLILMRAPRPCRHTTTPPQSQLQHHLI